MSYKLLINKDAAFGTLGIIITTLAILCVRTIGLIDKGPYNIDEIILHHQAIQTIFNTGVIPLHISNGYLMMVALFIKLSGLNPESYGIAVAMINLLSMAIMPISYYFVRNITGNNVLAWMTSVSLGLSAPYIYENYWHYGAGLGAMFIFASACLLVKFFADTDTNRNSAILLMFAGILMGIGHSCHRSSIFMTITLMLILFVVLCVKYCTGKINYRWAVRFFLLPCIGFWIPLLSIHFLVPVYHKLRFGTNYSDVANDMYFYDVHDYLGSLIRNYFNNMSLGKAVRDSMYAKNIWTVLYSTINIFGWFHSVLIAIGGFFCWQNKKYRYLLFFPLFYVVWIIPASFAYPGIYLRVMIPALVMLSIILACGWYQILVWAKALFERINVGNVVLKNSVYAIIFIITALLVTRPGILIIKNSGTGYRELVDWAVEKKVEPARILSYNHLLAYVYLKYWPVNPMDTKDKVKFNEYVNQIKNKYDYFVIETANVSTVHGIMLLMNDKNNVTNAIAPVKTIKHPIGNVDIHFIAQAGITEYLRFIRRPVAEAYSKNCIFIIETDKIARQ